MISRKLLSEQEGGIQVNITEVRVKLTEAKKNRLQAFCSITIDNDFVVRDLKVIEGHKGAFVAMPSRKLTDRCPKCGGKNHLMAQNCNEEIQKKVLAAYKEEVEKSKTPGYKPQKYEDMDDVDYIDEALNEDVDQKKSGK